MTTIGGIDNTTATNIAQFPRFSGSQPAGYAVNFGGEGDSFTRSTATGNRSNFYIPVLTESTIGLAIATIAGIGILGFGLRKGGFIRRMFSGGFNGIRNLLGRIPGVNKFIKGAEEGAKTAAQQTANAAA